MLCLRAVLGGRVLWEHRLEGGSAVLGRAPECALRIDNPLLSRRHARFVRRGNAWEATDLGSRNGLYLRGERLRGPTRLRDGDVLCVGKFAFEVELPDERGGGALARARLRVQDALLPLRKEVFVIGGAPDADFPLGGWRTPAHAALLVRGRGGHSLINVAPSADAVYHNGKPVSGRARLRPGDRLEVYGLRARFEEARE